MSNMVFLDPNKIETTTAITVPSNTAAAEYLIDQAVVPRYETVGNADDSVSSVIRIEFDNPTLINIIALQSHNLEQFRIFYDSATANTFLPDLTVEHNIHANSYFEFAPVQVSTLHLQMDKTVLPNEEKKVGELIASYKRMTFDRNPNFAGYTPTEYRKQIRHEMSDGGVALFNVADKFRAGFRFGYISDTFRADLYGIWKGGEAFYFVPSPSNVVLVEDLALDYFTNVDGTFIENHLSNSGHKWINDTVLTSPTLIIEGNALRHATGTAGGRIYLDAGLPNQDYYVQAVVRDYSQYLVEVGVTCRHKDTRDSPTNYAWMYRYGGGGASFVRLSKTMSNTTAILFSATTTVTGAGSAATFRIQAVANTIYGFINGSLICEVTDTSIQTNNNPGIHYVSVDRAGTNTSATLDDFVCRNIPHIETPAWDGVAHSVVWPGNFDFKQSANPADAGWSGSIQIEAT